MSWMSLSRHGHPLRRWGYCSFIASIPTTLIADNMAGHLMARGEVDEVVVGADRNARNWEVANKIGT